MRVILYYFIGSFTNTCKFKLQDKNDNGDTDTNSKTLKKLYISLILVTSHTAKGCPDLKVTPFIICFIIFSYYRKKRLGLY